MARLEKRFPRYSTLLKLYPANYQKQYREQMLLTLADMLDDKQNNKTSIWLRTTLDFPFSVTKQNVLFIGGIMAHETPNYVKRNALIGALLILPFFIFVIANSLTNHGLVISNSMKQLFLFLIVGLPAIALVLTIVTFVKWASERKAPFWKSLIDIRHNWPMAIVSALALLIVLFIPFHDSVHCVTGNPIKELRNIRQTERCILNG
jgi:hypothetical protein